MSQWPEHLTMTLNAQIKEISNKLPHEQVSHFVGSAARDKVQLFQNGAPCQLVAYPYKVKDGCDPRKGDIVVGFAALNGDVENQMFQRFLAKQITTEVFSEFLNDLKNKLTS